MTVTEKLRRLSLTHEDDSTSPTVSTRSNSIDSPAAETIFPEEESDVMDESAHTSTIPEQTILQVIKESKASWYDKILSYEPIVIEKLTAWLNDMGVQVTPKDTKAWCESNGICCMWEDKRNVNI